MAVKHLCYWGIPPANEECRNRSSIQAKTQEQRQRSLAGKIQDLSSEWMGKLANLSSNVARYVNALGTWV